MSDDDKKSDKKSDKRFPPRPPLPSAFKDRPKSSPDVARPSSRPPLPNAKGGASSDKRKSLRPPPVPRRDEEADDAATFKELKPAVIDDEDEEKGGSSGISLPPRSSSRPRPKRQQTALGLPFGDLFGQGSRDAEPEKKASPPSLSLGFGDDDDDDDITALGDFEIDLPIPSAFSESLEELELEPPLREALEGLDGELGALPDGPSKQAGRIHLHIARLLEGAGHPEIAAAHLRSARERNPRSLQTLHELRRFARADGRWSAVLELIDAELDLLSDASRRAELLEERGRILRHQRDAGEGLVDLQAVLQLSPRTTSALEAIKGIHVEGERWNDVVELLTTLADVTRDSARQVACLVLAAEITEHVLGLADEATDRYVAALKLDPRHAVAYAGVERLLIARKRWGELHRLTLKYAEATPDSDLRFALLLQAGRIAAERLQRKAAAVKAFQDAHSLRPDDPLPLRQLAALLRQGEDHRELEGIYVRLLSSAHPSERSLLMIRRADNLIGLGELEAGVRVLLSLLEAEPTHPEALHRVLPRLLEHNLLKEYVELQWARAERTPQGHEQLARFMALARSCERYPKALVSARECYHRVLGLQPDHHEAFMRLEGMLRHSGEYPELAELIEETLEHVSDDHRAASLQWELATLREHHLRDNPGAIHALNAYRALRPRDLHAIWALQRLTHSERRYEELVQALDAELELTEGATRRAVLLYRKGQNLQLHLERTADAVEVYREAIAADSRHIASHRALCAALRELERYTDLASALRAMIEVLPRDAQPEVYVELGSLYADRLANRREAIQAYEAALDADDRNVAALEGLERIHHDAQQWAELREVFERQVALDLPTGRRAGILLSIATLLVERFDQPLQAEKVAKDALELIPGYRPALLLLERIYGSDGRWEALENLLSSTIVETTDDTTRAELAHRLASLLAWRAGDPEGALKPLEIAIDSDKSRADLHITREVLARHLDKTSLLLSELFTQAQRATDVADAVAFLKEALALQIHVLEDNPSTTARAVLKQAPLDTTAVEVLEARVDSDPLRLDLWQRRLKRAEGDEPVELRMALAGLLTGSPDARALLGEALELAPEHLPGIRAAIQAAQVEGQHEALCLLYEREAGVLQNRAQKVEAYLAGAHVARDNLGQLTRARQMLASALELEPQNSDTYSALSKLLRGQQQWRVLSENLRVHIDALNPSARATRLIELTLLYRDHLGEPERAIETLHELLDLQPQHTEALSTLAQLEEGRAHWQEAVSAYRAALKTQRGDVPERRQWRLSLARILIEHLQQVQEAEPVLLEQLDLDPRDTDALALLARVYELLKRWSDASETLRTLADLLDPKASAEVLVRLALIARQQEWSEDADALLVEAAQLLLKDIGALKPLLSWGQETGEYRRLADLFGDVLVQAPVSVHDMLIPVRLALATILADKLDDRMEAEKEARHAARTDPSSVDAQLLASRLQINRGDTRKFAYAALEADPFCVQAYRVYADTLVEERLQDEVGFVAQVLEVLDARDDDLTAYAERVANAIHQSQQPLGEHGLVQFLAHPDEPGWARELLSIAGHKAQIFALQNTPSFSIPDGYADLQRAAAEIEELLGVSSLEVQVAHADISVTHDTEKPNRIILGERAIAGSDAERRFHIGYAASHLLSGTTLLHILDDRDFLRLIQGLLGLANSNFGDDEARKQLSRFLSRRQRKAVINYVNTLNTRELHLELNTWRDAAIATSVRCGLLVCGDVRAGAAALLRRHGHGLVLTSSPADQVRALQTIPEAGELLRFAVSQQFWSARKAMGLR